MSKVIGTVGEPQGRRNGWSQSLGDYTEFIWHGTPSYVSGIYAQQRGNCAETDVEIDGASGICRARFAGSTEPGGTPELRVEIRRARNDVQKSIFESGPDGYTVSVPDEELRKIKKLLDSNSDADFLDWLGDSTLQGIDLYNLALAGVEYRTVTQMIITQVTTTNSQYQWESMDTNANAIFSRATMLNTLRSTPNFNVPQNPGTAPTGFYYGWRLLTPTYETTSDGNSTETLEFEFGLWSSTLHPNFV